MRLSICLLAVFCGIQAWAVTQPPMKVALAYSGNYTPRNRPHDYKIKYIVIHSTEGSYEGAISWFRDARARVSAHYIINNHACPRAPGNKKYPDGEITMSVDPKDVAWHDPGANNWAIGIEHAAKMDAAGNNVFSDVMYRKSAHLTAWLCEKYGIPISRDVIVGHYEDHKIGGTSDHTDPGRSWNWDLYMRYVREYAGGSPSPSPSPIKVGDHVCFSETVNLRNGPCTTNSIIDTASIGAKMAVVGGPSAGCGYTWYQVRTPSGANAWAAHQAGWYYTCQSPTPVIKVGGSVCFKDVVNIRTGPCTTNPVAAASSIGSKMAVIGGPNTGCGYTWWQVRTPMGVTGWAAHQAAWYEAR